MVLEMNSQTRFLSRGVQDQSAYYLLPLLQCCNLFEIFSSMSISKNIPIHLPNTSMATNNLSTRNMAAVIIITKNHMGVTKWITTKSHMVVTKPIRNRHTVTSHTNQPMKPLVTSKFIFWPWYIEHFEGENLHRFFNSLSRYNLERKLVMKFLMKWKKLSLELWTHINLTRLEIQFPHNKSL